MPIWAPIAGSLAGGLLGGLLGGGGKDPTLAHTEMRPDGKVAYDAVQASADRPEEAFATEVNQGLADDARGIVDSPQAQSVDQSLGGPSLLGDAMRERSQKRFASDIARIQRQGQIGAYDRKRKAQDVSYNLGFQKEQIEADLEAKRVTYNREADAARNQVLGQVLGNVGSAIGVAVGQMGRGGAAPAAAPAAASSPSAFWDQSSYKFQGPLGGSSNG